MKKISNLHNLTPKPKSESGPKAGQWEGTVLAKFAEDVIALNRQAGLPPPSTMSDGQTCRVASLESLQRGLKIKKTPSDLETPAQEQEDLEVVSIRRLHKE